MACQGHVAPVRRDIRPARIGAPKDVHGSGLGAAHAQASSGSNKASSQSGKAASPTPVNIERVP